MTVILSIGRHECYGKGSLPLSPEGISGAWLSAEIIARQCGSAHTARTPTVWLPSTEDYIISAAACGPDGRAQTSGLAGKR